MPVKFWQTSMRFWFFLSYLSNYYCTYIKTFNEFSLDGILSKHIFILFRSKDSESRKASQYCTTSIVGAFSLGFRPQTAMGSAAATASIADLTPSCNTSYYTAQQPTDAKCKSLSWVKINLDEAFLFYSFIRNSSLHVSSTYYNWSFD